MLKIILLLGVFDIIRCEMQTTRLERTMSTAPSCSNPSLCYLSDTYKTEPRSLSFLPYPISPHVRKQQLIQRSYYGGYGSSSPAYYHQYVFLFKYLSIESFSLIAFVDNKHILALLIPSACWRHWHFWHFYCNHSPRFLIVRDPSCRQ